MVSQIFNKLFGRNPLATAALYGGIGLLLLAAVPSQPALQALDDGCNGQCPEGMICVGNDEGGYECQCVVEE